jgi:hypothetical protein
MAESQATQKPSAAVRKAGAGQSAGPAHPAQRAAAQVIDKHTLRITLPDNLGTIRLPEPERLAFYGGIVTLAAFGIVEWPVAAVLGIGHLLADDHHHKCLCEFGEALAEA